MPRTVLVLAVGIRLVRVVHPNLGVAPNHWLKFHLRRALNSMATSWLEKILPQIRTSKDRKASQVPEGLWRKCPACEAILYRPELARSLDVCPKCDHHMRVSARRRLEMFFDADASLNWLGESFAQRDPLKFKDSKKYKDRLQSAEKMAKTSEALVVAEGPLQGEVVVVAAFEFKFMGGSMGTAVGSRFVAGVKRAIELGVPFICFSASGGARMQEAVLSLMQMAKVSAALEQLALAKLPYVSIMTDPVYGGVSASLAMLGDINMAEPNALIGFTGPRVIEQTVRQKLPEGFQRSEFLLAHGSIDMIVHRHELRETVGRLLLKFQGNPVREVLTDLVTEAEDTAAASTVAGEVSPEVNGSPEAVAALPDADTETVQAPEAAPVPEKSNRADEAKEGKQVQDNAGDEGLEGATPTPAQRRRVKERQRRPAEAGEFSAYGDLQPTR